MRLPVAADGPGFSIWLATCERNPGNRRDINRDGKETERGIEREDGGGRDEREVQRRSQVLAQTK